jgi:hypothetical protein
MDRRRNTWLKAIRRREDVRRKGGTHPTRAKHIAVLRGLGFGRRRLTDGLAEAGGAINMQKMSSVTARG